MCPKESPPASDAGNTQSEKESPHSKRDVAYPLLPLLPEASMEVLQHLGPALERVLPLKPKHREDLPQAVRDLSAQLTSERSGLAGGYLQSPRTLAAYAHFFLPWNIYRQARILAGQWLRLHNGARILDLGAGPLTSAMALWAARPDLRDKELHFVCVDRARKAVRLGQQLFRELGGIWRVETVDQNMEMYLRQKGHGVDLVILGNVLNELRWSNFVPLEVSVAEVAGKVLQRLHGKRQGHVLVIEPGTRFGGRITSLFRKACVEQGLSILSPCTHQEVCPMLDHRTQSWCHFRFEATGLPQWLEKLSEEASLTKETLAVSFAHLAQTQAKHEGKGRVVSAEIRLPERESRGYYVCAEDGLLLLETNRATFDQGDAVSFALQPGPQRDRKSGALFAHLPEEPGFTALRPPIRGAERRGRAEDGRRSENSRRPGAPKRPGGPKPYDRSGKGKRSSQAGRSSNAEQSGQGQGADDAERSGQKQRSGQNDHSGPKTRSSGPKTGGKGKPEGNKSQRHRPSRPAGGKSSSNKEEV